MKYHSMLALQLLKMQPKRQQRVAIATLCAEPATLPAACVRIPAQRHRATTRAITALYTGRFRYTTAPPHTAPLPTGEVTGTVVREGRSYRLIIPPRDRLLATTTIQ